jgi:hypothetical protein
MKVYFNGFWSGFLEKTNPVHCQFFLDLFTKVWNEPIELGDMDSSEILCESLDGSPMVMKKSWKYTVLFSGESRLQKEPIDHLYTFVLYGQRNNKNRINCPLFVPYLYCNDYLKVFESQSPRTNVPQNAVLAIISNPSGKVRNSFLDALEKRVPVCYAGSYKNNMGGTIVPSYNTPEFQAFVSQFKCVVAMENSIEDTYITEKICHGFLAQTVPIYWGSPRINDYFNKDRFICLENEYSIDITIDKVIELMNDDTKWISMVNQSIYAKNKLWRSIDVIARDCRNLFEQGKAFGSLGQIYFLCEKEYEPSRYERLACIVNLLGISHDSYKYLSPTYKHTITDEMYAKHVKTPLQELLPWCKRGNQRRADLSLILNFRAALEDIDKNYLNGMFLILESDVVFTEEVTRIKTFFEEVEKRNKDWHCIHIGYGNDEYFWQTPFQESLTKEGDTIRLSRHLDTRCTDSMLWTKKGVELMLEYMLKTEDYSEPIDHYISRYLENNQEKFSFYWSRPTFFKQLTNYGKEESTIQNDKF